MIMKIDNILLDKLRALESGTVILEMNDGAYEPIGPADMLPTLQLYSWGMEVLCAEKQI